MEFKGAIYEASCFKSHQVLPSHNKSGGAYKSNRWAFKRPSTYSRDLVLNRSARSLHQRSGYGVNELKSNFKIAVQIMLRYSEGERALAEHKTDSEF